MEEKIEAIVSKLILQNQGKGNITGICDVVSLMKMQLSWTRIWSAYHQGKELHVSRLTLKRRGGHRGTIDSMVYSSMKPSESRGILFTRLFKWGHHEQQDSV